MKSKNWHYEIEKTRIFMMKNNYVAIKMIILKDSQLLHKTLLRVYRILNKLDNFNNEYKQFWWGVKNIQVWHIYFHKISILIQFNYEDEKIINIIKNDLIDAEINFLMRGNI